MWRNSSTLLGYGRCLMYIWGNWEHVTSVTIQTLGIVTWDKGRQVSLSCDGKRGGTSWSSRQGDCKRGMGFSLGMGNMVHRSSCLSFMTVCLRQLLLGKEILKCIILLLHLVYSCISFHYTLWFFLLLSSSVIFQYILKN